LIAGGVALEALALAVQPTLKHLAGFVLLLLGLCVPVAAWVAWAPAERAMRLKRPLPSSPLFALLAAGVTVVAVLVTVGSLMA
jgi:putative membrane protein